MMTKQESYQISGFDKDDSTEQAKIAYYCLLVCFIALASIGAVNVYLAKKIRKFSKAVVAFYLTSELVIVFRIILFSDPFFDWSDVSYVVILIAMPSYLYLLVGLSQVVLILESIIKYRNFKIREESTISACMLKRQVQLNQRILTICYIVLYTLMAILILSFAITTIVYAQKGHTFDGTYFAPLVLAISTIVVWFLLTLATCSFVSMLNKRFGEAEFTGPKRKLLAFLCVFSLSFFVRGTWDLFIHFWDIEFNESGMAAVIFAVYFLTEWLPIFVIYLNHLLAFLTIIRRQKQRCLTEVTVATNAGENYGHDENSNVANQHQQL